MMKIILIISSLFVLASARAEIVTLKKVRQDIPNGSYLRIYAGAYRQEAKTEIEYYSPSKQKLIELSTEEPYLNVIQTLCNPRKFMGIRPRGITLCWLKEKR